MTARLRSLERLLAVRRLMHVVQEGREQQMDAAVRKARRAATAWEAVRAEHAIAASQAALTTPTISPLIQQQISSVLRREAESRRDAALENAEAREQMRIAAAAATRAAYRAKEQAGSLYVRAQNLAAMEQLRREQRDVDDRFLMHKHRIPSE